MSYLSNIASSRIYAMDIRLFNLGFYLKQKYSNIWNSFYAIRKSAIKKRTMFTIFFNLLPDVYIGMIMIWLVTEIMAGVRTIGEYTLYTGLTGQLAVCLFSIIAVITNVYEDRMKIENIQKFNDIEEKITNDGKKILTGNIVIEFRDVSFGYPGTDKRILSKINFSIKSKEKVCIVGVNGAGKSTIVKLLLRFYDVSEGEIIINGHNIKEYDIGSLRKCFSSFFQSIVNYSFTLRDNIKISDLENEHLTESEVLEALRKSDALNIVDGFQHGLDQYITKLFDEEGAELSEGQYQKIALARTFYRNCSAMILDEPSASLDPEAEYNLFRYLEEFCKDKTTIFTSHRLSNIHLADNIIFLENGTVDKDTHIELMRRNKRYATLYHYQADKYSQ